MKYKRKPYSLMPLGVCKYKIGRRRLRMDAQ